MKQEINRLRYSKDEVSQRDIKRANLSKSPIDNLDLKTRHEIFYRKADQGGRAERKSEDHQNLVDLEKIGKKNLQEMQTLQQDYKKAHAYYEMHKNNPDNQTIDDYNLYVKGFNARRKKFANKRGTVTEIEKDNVARLEETSVQKLDLPPELKLKQPMQCPHKISCVERPEKQIVP